MWGSGSFFSGSWFWDLGFSAWDNGLGFRALKFGVTVRVLGVWVWGLGFRVWNLVWGLRDKGFVSHPWSFFRKMVYPVSSGKSSCFENQVTVNLILRF